MKKIFNIPIIILVLFATCGFPENVIEPSDMELGFLYYKTSKLPVPWDHFANHYAEYRSAADEFQKTDIIEKIKPLLEEMQQKVLNANSFIIKFGATIGEYNFESEGFPTGIIDTTFIPTPVNRSNMKRPDFAIEFTNASNYSLLKIKKEEARKKVLFLRDSRKVLIELEFVPKSAEEKRITYDVYRAILGEIKRIKVFSSTSGQLIGEMSSQ